MSKTNIAWTDVTDNILVVEGGGWWCKKISPGCAKCYAATLNQNSFFGGNKLSYSGKAPKLVLREDILDSWARQTKPKRHFVASMTDVFGEWVSDEYCWKMIDAMVDAPNQTFQVLTKRPEVALYHVKRYLDAAEGMEELPANIWIGTSVEDQHRAHERIPILIDIPAKIRFLSVEPMLEQVDLSRWLSVETGRAGEWRPVSDLPDDVHLNWIIFGGESGEAARPCKIDWIRDGVQQCKAARVSCFVKQLGAYSVFDNPGEPSGVSFAGKLNHKKGGDMSEWPEDLRVREFPKV